MFNGHYELVIRRQRFLIKLGNLLNLYFYTFLKVYTGWIAILTTLIKNCKIRIFNIVEIIYTKIMKLVYSNGYGFNVISYTGSLKGHFHFFLKISDAISRRPV